MVLFKYWFIVQSLSQFCDPTVFHWSVCVYNCVIFLLFVWLLPMFLFIDRLISWWFDLIWNIGLTNWLIRSFIYSFISHTIDSELIKGIGNSFLGHSLIVWRSSEWMVKVKGFTEQLYPDRVIPMTFQSHFNWEVTGI